MKVERRCLSEIVAEELEGQIRQGRYKAGERLPTEPELMKMFSVGRSSVREAMKLLTLKGIIKVRQGAGTFVAPLWSDNASCLRINDADSTELEEVRKILEVAIAERAAANRTVTDIGRMRSALAKRKTCVACGSLDECIRADLDFHIAVADATGNRILADIYRSATHHLLEDFNRIYREAGCFLASQPSHEKLLRHIVDADTKNARKAAVTIIEEP